MITNNKCEFINFGLVLSFSQTCSILFNTIANNTGSDVVSDFPYPCAGIFLEKDSSGAPSLIIKNNIVSGNAGYGLYTEDSFDTIDVDYNDIWNHEVDSTDGNYYNIVPGPNDISDDPLFFNPALDNFHLKANSPCIDAGIDTGTSDDIDGDSRPHGEGFDIGADEALPATGWDTPASVIGIKYKSTSDMVNHLLLLIVPLVAVLHLKTGRKRL